MMDLSASPLKASSRGSTNLTTLSFDVLFIITSRLGLQDWGNLRRVNKSIYELLKNESIARQVINVCKPNLLSISETDNYQRNIAYTKEGKRARDGRYYETLVHVCCKRDAFATARSYVISNLARGEDFIYNEGVLCYVSSSVFHIIRIHDRETIRISSAVEVTIPSDISLLHCKDGILSCRIRSHVYCEGFKSPAPQGVFTPLLCESEIIFVRNNKFFLCYGQFLHDKWQVI